VGIPVWHENWPGAGFSLSDIGELQKKKSRAKHSFKGDSAAAA
jgi:hypothetical protein